MTEISKPYIGKAVQIEDAISRLEGWAFGKLLSFTTAGYHLHIDIGHGWTKVSDFRPGLPGLDDFARELNDAIAPVRERYAKRLRQELSAECSRLALVAHDRHGLK